MVAPSHRLRHLQMRKSRHRPISPRRSLRQKRLHQRFDPCNRRITLIAHPQPEIQRHLIIARPRRVQPACRFTNHFFQPRLDIHVNVFQFNAELKLSCFNL